MTSVTKIDAIHTLNNDIANELLHSSNTMVWLIDKHKKAYAPFMPDPEARNSRHYNESERPVDIHADPTHPLIARIIDSETPVAFSLEKIADRPGIPTFIKLSYDKGIRSILAMRLKCRKETIGFIVINSRRSDGFPESFRNILQSIAPLLSVVVRNIIPVHTPATTPHLSSSAIIPSPPSTIIGSGSEMQKVYQKMSLVAGSNSTVLVLGETGTGKELIARAIHNASPRKDMPMIKVNCAALPANLIESELFGHEKGAFTGAIDRRLGKFELANNGTLFLDEIGEMPVELQVRLLRVIQEREFERVGGRSTIKVNVRLIAATNRNLEDEVRLGRFRQDLFYRLNVFPIHLPALRQRTEDIEPLAKFFLARFNKENSRKITTISPDVIKALEGYTWPGNVREFEHLMERSVLMTQGNVLNEIQLPKLQKEQKKEKADLPPKTLQDLERTYIIEILRKYDGKISGDGGASQFLAIPATTLHSKMKKLGISKVDYFSRA